MPARGPLDAARDVAAGLPPAVFIAVGALGLLLLILPPVLRRLRGGSSAGYGDYPLTQAPFVTHVTYDSGPAGWGEAAIAPATEAVHYPPPASPSAPPGPRPLLELPPVSSGLALPPVNHPPVAGGPPASHPAGQQAAAPVPVPASAQRAAAAAPGLAERPSGSPAPASSQLPARPPGEVPHPREITLTGVLQPEYPPPPADAFSR